MNHSTQQIQIDPNSLERSTSMLFTTSAALLPTFFAIMSSVLHAIAPSSMIKSAKISKTSMQVAKDERMGGTSHLTICRYKAEVASSRFKSLQISMEWSDTVTCQWLHKCLCLNAQQFCILSWTKSWPSPPARPARPARPLLFINLRFQGIFHFFSLTLGQPAVLKKKAKKHDDKYENKFQTACPEIKYDVKVWV